MKPTLNPDTENDTNKQVGILRQKVYPQKIARSKQLRQEMTLAEEMLWEQLRTNRLSGFHFRRQQVIQGFIVDFYCHHARLIIEVDGDIHAEHVEFDLERDRVLSELGFHIIRIQNSSILMCLDQILDMILNACTDGAASFPPSRPGKGG